MKKILSEDQKLARAAYAKEWRKKNPEKAAKNEQKRRLNTKDKIKARQEKWLSENREKHINNSKEWYKKNKERVRNKQLLRSFGITLEKYKEMLLAQNNKCAICENGPDEKSKMFAVDHNHNTGRVRALLCRGCNVGIGNLRDSVTILEKALKYLKNHS